MLRHCPTCDDLHEKGARCPESVLSTQRIQDAKRGTSAERGYDAAWRSLVAQVIRRDGGICQLARPGCTRMATSGDHVVPLSRGGARLDPSNVVAACHRCNSGKGNR